MQKEKSRTMLSLLLFAAATGMCVYGARGADEYEALLDAALEAIGR